MKSGYQWWQRQFVAVMVAQPEAAALSGSASSAAHQQAESGVRHQLHGHGVQVPCTNAPAESVCLGIHGHPQQTSRKSGRTALKPQGEDGPHFHRVRRAAALAIRPESSFLQKGVSLLQNQVSGRRPV